MTKNAFHILKHYVIPQILNLGSVNCCTKIILTYGFTLKSLLLKPKTMITVLLYFKCKDNHKSNTAKSSVTQFL